MTELSDEARAELLDRLAAIIARHGPTGFVAAPILEPTDVYFPDPYRDDLIGVRTVARRLMTYAGLGDLPVEVCGPSVDPDAPLPETVIALTEAGATGIELTVVSRGRAEDVPLVLAHEIARAFTTLHAGPSGGGHPYRSIDLEAPELDGDQEEEVSLTAYHLGFGLLATKGAHQYRAQGELQGVMTVTRWMHMAVGALAPIEATYLLAVQAVVRRVEPATVEGWLAYLGPNERADLKRFLRELSGDEDALAERLGLPPRDTWPAAADPATAPLEDDGWTPQPLEQDDAPSLRHPVFRVPEHRGWTFAKITLGLGAGAFVGAFAFAEPLAWPTLAVAGVATALAWWVGRHLPADDTCSACEAVLPPSVDVCPSCDGAIRGKLAPGESRLEAEERLADVSAFGVVVAGEQADAAARYVERGVKCPHCGWIPDGEAHWACDACDAPLFNTFAHGGECPACAKVFEETSCPRCDHFSPYEWWWPDGGT